MAQRKRKKPKKKSRFLASVMHFLFAVFVKSVPFVLLVAVVCGAGLLMKNYIYADTNFTVANVRITATGPYASDEVIRRGELTTGESIFTVDIRRIEALLTADPKIKRAHVRRVFPNVLDITLDVRQGVLAVQLSQAPDCYMLDEEGVVMDVLEKDAVPTDMLIIQDGAATVTTLTPGSVYYPGTIANAFFVTKYLISGGYYPNTDISYLAIDHLGGFSVWTKQGLEIKLGNTRLHENLDKLALVPKILEANTKPLKYIDLRFDDIIVK